MEQPAMEDSTNRESMLSGFYEECELSHQLTQEEVAKGNAEYCEGIAYLETYDPLFRKEISSEELRVRNTITLTGNRSSDPLLAGLTQEEQQQIASRGWTIVPVERIPSRFNHPMDYSPEVWTSAGYTEERVNTATILAGSHDAHRRYPFNTLLVTDDLLLHGYHKLFSNALKYYEEQIARPTL